MRISLAATLLILSLPLGAAPAWSASHPKFESLLADLKSPNTKTRREAAAALGKSKKREAVSGLSAVVRDPEPKVRLEVVRALHELHDPAGIPALVTATEDEEMSIRGEAVTALVDLYIESERPNVLEKFLGLGGSDEDDEKSVIPGATVEPSVIRALTGALRDDDKEIREQAALSLGFLGATGSLKELTAALQDPEATVRGGAALAIAKLGGGESTRPLIGLLADESDFVRRRAIQALGLLKPKEAAGPLREVFEANRKKRLGVRALDALTKIGDPTQGDLFRELLTDDEGERKRLAIEGLARIADTAQLPAFKKDFQREKNDELKLAYGFGIAKLGDHAFLDTLVLNLPAKSLGRRCREYLVELGRPILSELYEYLGDPSDDVRAALCETLAQVGDAETIRRLAPLVKDPNERVADSANRAIERLKRATGAVASAP